jgi:hypothetical protein
MPSPAWKTRENPFNDGGILLSNPYLERIGCFQQRKRRCPNGLSGSKGRPHLGHRNIKASDPGLTTPLLVVFLQLGFKGIHITEQVIAFWSIFKKWIADIDKAPISP